MIVLLLGCFFLLGAIAFFYDLESTYHPNTTAEFDSVMGNLTSYGYSSQADSVALSSDVKNQFYNITTGTTSTPVDSISAGTWGAFRLLYKIPSITWGVLTTFSYYIGLPTYLLGIIISLIIVFIVSISIAYIFNR